MRNQIFTLALSTVAASMIFTACGDSSSGSDDIAAQGESKATLENGKVVYCDSEHESVVAALADGSFRRCEDGFWVKISESEAQKAEEIIGQEGVKSSSSQASGAGEKPGDQNEKSSSSAKPAKPMEISSSSVDKDPVEELYECPDGSLVANLDDCEAIEPSSSSGSSEMVSYGKMTDARDNQTYKTVTIGAQTWMAENLNYDYNVGSVHSYVNDDHPEYGRYYTWNAAVAGCPVGWHLPNDNEWETLFEAVGGTDEAGKLLKSDSELWNTFEGNEAEGTNDFGFAVLPAGDRYGSGSFSNAGYYAYFWSSSEFNSSYANYWYFRYDSVRVYNGFSKDYGYSVRCLRDSDEGSSVSSSSFVIPDPEQGSSSSVASSSSVVTVSSSSVSSPSSSSATTEELAVSHGEMTDSRDDQTYKTVTIGTQTWMAENLNYEYNDGSANSYCYRNLNSYCEIYGRLYNWYAAMVACPAGWHLPSIDEWQVFFSAIGGTSKAGPKLRTLGYWQTPYGFDTYRFAVLPAGFLGRNGFDGIKIHASFWSSSEAGIGYARCWFVQDRIENITDYYWDDMSYGFSVRCLKD